MKKKTRKHAGLGSGSFFFCMTAEEHELLQNLRWKRRATKHHDFFLGPSQQTIA